jgi:hypothetical protein
MISEILTEKINRTSEFWETPESWEGIICRVTLKIMGV